MRRLLPHRRAPSPSGRASVPKKLGLILSHRLSHMIPLFVMWLVCLNLVSAALTPQDYQRNQALEPSVELPALTGSSGSGATGSGASPADSNTSSPITPTTPAAADTNQPSNKDLATSQPAPATVFSCSFLRKIQKRPL